MTPEAFSSGGSHHEVSDLILDWTLGEFVTETIHSNGTQLTQGYHQGNLNISTRTLDLHSDLILNIYPNPTAQSVILETQKIESQKIMVFDMLGHMLLYKEISEYETSIDLSPFSDGIYLLAVQSGRAIIQWVTIEKIH